MSHLLQWLGQRVTLNTLQLEVGSDVQHTVVHEIFVSNGLLVAVVVAGRTVSAVKQIEGVVIDIVGRCRGQSELNGVEVGDHENGLVALVDRSVAFVGDEGHGSQRQTLR